MDNKTDTQKMELHLNILKGAVENANEAFVTIDQDSTVIFFNKAAEKIFGYGRDEVIGYNLGKILGPECLAGHSRAVAHYVRTRKSVLLGHESEFRAMRKNKETFAASISFSLAEVDGKLFFTGIVRDITETKALQEQIIRGERLAALGQTVAEISHEIKNPLALIGGFARQLSKGIQGPKELEKLNLISTEVTRLENLLAGLKNLYTPKKLDLEKIDVYELLSEIHSLVEEECKTKRITVDLRIHKGDMFIEGDREKLKQVLLNVLKNSIEALEQDGSLAIESTYTANKVEIAVIDEGPGIPEKAKQKIFDPFFTTKKQGTGLGLCIAKRIIEDHKDGSFSVHSEEGKGTAVRIVMARCV